MELDRRAPNMPMAVNDLISTFYPFSKLKLSQLKQLSLIIDTRYYKKNEIVYNEGDEADYFYVLEKGRVIALSSIDGQ